MIRALRGWPRRSVGVFGRRSVGRGIILQYHRIAEGQCDPWQLSVSPAHFEEHMDTLAAHGQALSLSDAVRSLHARRTPHRFVSVTFDDGYADNLTVAKPILTRLGIPATLFVPSTYVDAGKGLWWDLLQRLVLEPSTFPPVIELHIAGREHRWTLGDASCYDAETALRHSHWNIRSAPPTQRHFLYTTLHQLLLPLSYQEQHEALDALAAQRSAPASELVRHRVLTADELRRFVEPGLLDVGAHSETHPVLSKLSVPEQRREVRGSGARLEEIVGEPVTMFAYPYGGRGTYTAQTKQLVLEARYEGACVHRAAAVDNSIDRFELPRFQVGSWGAREFSRHLRRWFRG